MQYGTGTPGIVRAGIAATVMRRGTSRLLHISRILMIKEALDLSDEQVKDLREIRVELARKVIKLTSDIRAARFDSFQTVVAKPVDFNQLRSNAKAVSQLRLQRKTAVIDAFEKASNILSQEQKEKLSDHIAAWVDEYEAETEESEQ